MIPWWGWVAIWAGLVLALVATLALCAWWLFRKAMALLDDVGELADKATLLEADDAELPRQTRAILADVRDIRAREDARRRLRAVRRTERHRRRMERARRITSAGASQQQWPADWY